MITKLIFLDIDGVLNSVRSMVALHEEYKASWATSEDTLKNKLLRNYIDPIAVKLLNRITDHNLNVGLVISSSHRKLYRDPDKLLKHIRDLGITGEVLGVTPDDPRGFRGNEIREWLVKNNRDNQFTHYVIIDDSSDMSDAQKLYHFVPVDANNGLSLENYKQIHILLELRPQE